jgi:hypothetical protein
VLLSDGHDFLDHLCFDFSLLESPERLFDMLTANVRQEQARLLEEALLSKRTVQTMQKIIEESKIKELVLDELFSFMREAVLLNFRNSLIDSQRITHLLEEEKQRKKDFSIFWRNITPEHRQNLLLLGTPPLYLDCKDAAALETHLGRQGIQLS